MVRTVPVADPGDLIAQLPGPGSLAWIRQGEGLAGWGEVARVTVPAGQDRFTAADKWLRALLDGGLIEDRVGAPGCGPVAFGSFTFDPTSEGSVLILPQVILAGAGARRGLPPSAASRPPRRTRPGWRSTGSIGTGWVRRGWLTSQGRGRPSPARSAGMTAASPRCNGSGPSRRR